MCSTRTFTVPMAMNSCLAICGFVCAGADQAQHFQLARREHIWQRRFPAGRTAPTQSAVQKLRAYHGLPAQETVDRVQQRALARCLDEEAVRATPDGLSRDFQVIGYLASTRIRASGSSARMVRGAVVCVADGEHRIDHHKVRTEAASGRYRGRGVLRLADHVQPGVAVEQRAHSREVREVVHDEHAGDDADAPAQLPPLWLDVALTESVDAIGFSFPTDALGSTSIGSTRSFP